MASSCLYKRFVSAVVLFALLFNITRGVSADMDPLLPTCKSLGGGSTYFGIDFCMKALGSDSRSRHTKDEVVLSGIVADLLKTNATSTAAKINGLIQKTGAEATKRCLASCQALYSGIVQMQAGCAAAIKSGKLDMASSFFEKSASSAKECENGFSKSHVVSTLTVEDDNAFKLAKLGAALLNFPH